MPSVAREVMSPVPFATEGMLSARTVDMSSVKEKEQKTCPMLQQKPCPLLQQKARPLLQHNTQDHSNNAEIKLTN